MKRIKSFLPLFALMLCVGAFLFPMTAFAAASPDPNTPDSTPLVPSMPVSSDSTGETGSNANGAGAFTPNGGGTVQDNAAQQEGKEFFTITATDGSVYYLIIDRQRGTQNVYFLSAVTKGDLVSLADNGGVSQSGVDAPAPTVPSASEPEPTQTAQPEKPAQNGGGKMGTIIFILIAVVACGGAGYYFKIVKPRKNAAETDEYEEYEDEDTPDDDSDDEYYFDDADGDRDTEDAQDAEN